MEEEEELTYIKSTHCGYCHQKKPMEKSWSLKSVANMMKDKGYCNSSSITFQGEELSFAKYEELMKDGWRRSGGFMYKPDLLRSCCRQYTIRTNYNLFIDDGYYNKSNKKSIRRFYNAMETNVEVPNGSSLLETYQKKDNRGKFISVLLPNTFAMDKFELFKKYQMSVHKEKASEINEYSFYNFLCHDPFPGETKIKGKVDWREVNRQWRTGQIGEELLNLEGPIHECYLIDEKLIAIAVLDILPTTISSVYFIWDPDYAHLGLGTVSAIREIVMAKLLKKDHYYMGFYIPDCEKMIYKAKFGGEIRNFINEEATNDNDNNADNNEKLKWVKLTHVDKMLKDGGFKVFEKRPGDNGKDEYIDVAEELYGVDGSSDPGELSSFKVVRKTSLFETPDVIPGLKPVFI